MSAELAAERRWQGNSQVLISASYWRGWCQGRPGDPRDWASGKGRTNSLDQARSSPDFGLGPEFPHGADEPDWPQASGGKERGLAKMTLEGVPRPTKIKEWVLLTVPKEWVARKAETLSPTRETTPVPGAAH